MTHQPPVAQFRDPTKGKQLHFCEYCCKEHEGHYHALHCGHQAYGVRCRDAEKTLCKTCSNNDFVGIVKHCEYCNRKHWGVLSTKFRCKHIGFGRCAKSFGESCATCEIPRKLKKEKEERERERACDVCGESVVEVSMRFCTFCGDKVCTAEDCFHSKTSACRYCKNRLG